MDVRSARRMTWKPRTVHARSVAGPMESGNAAITASASSDQEKRESVSNAGNRSMPHAGKLPTQRGIKGHIAQSNVFSIRKRSTGQAIVTSEKMGISLCTTQSIQTRQNPAGCLNIGL